jgi:heme oxygenase (biliverdin-IX-beta and delta-forming)
MDLDYLRQATRSDHEATESTVSLMDPALTRADYVEVLQRMYGAVRAWDEWSTVHAPPVLAPLLAGRHRSPLIAADLDTLQAPTPSIDNDTNASLAAYLQGDETQRTAAFLGAMYVIEGSTLGGQYIARHVEQTLGFEPGHGDSYFRGYGDQTGSMWRDFKAVLAEVPDAHTDLVVQSAKQMFAFFAAHMTDTAQNKA